MAARGKPDKGKPDKERRQHDRAAAHATVIVIDGKSFLTKDLSVGGALLDDYDGPLSPGALFTVTGIGLKNDITPVNVRARVNRMEGAARRLALTFLDLDAKAFDILRAARDARQRGLSLLPAEPDPMTARKTPAGGRGQS